MGLMRTKRSARCTTRPIVDRSFHPCRDIRVSCPACLSVFPRVFEIDADAVHAGVIRFGGKPRIVGDQREPEVVAETGGR